MSDNKKLLSLVFPVLNEEAIIPHLISRIQEIEKSLQRYDFELIFVDDGSTDNSLRVLKEYSLQRERIRIVSFSRNFGQQFAFYAGLSRSTGDAAILLDSDLQDPPELLPKLLEAYEEGFDIVSTKKTSRKESFFKRISYFFYYRIANLLSESEVLVDSGDFGLLSRRVINTILAMPESQLYLRGLREWTGYKKKVILFDRPERIFGNPSYTTRKLFSLALDGILSFSVLPLRFSGVLGGCTVVLSFLFFTYTLYIKFTDATSPTGFTAIVSLLLFTSGIQLLSLAVIGEYIGRIYREVKRRPRFIINEEYGSRGKQLPVVDSAQ